MVSRVLFLALGVLFYSSILFAQRQTGAMEGTVRDMNGQPLTGVGVTVSSPSMIAGTAVAVTNENGFYRFPVLAPGSYEVKMELTGFQTLIRRDVSLSAGSTQTVHFTVAMTSLSEILEVIANPPLIDVSTPAVSFTIPRTFVENLPKTNSIENLMALTPGVSDNLGFDRGETVNLLAYGAAGEVANSVWIDGVNVSNPKAGDLTMGYNQSWIDEVQVIGIGAPAEYGGFTGVLANYTTRSGGNQFHGLFETFFQNENLASTNVPDPGPGKPFKTYDFSAQFGGPILKDKLWFFTGVQYPHTETPTPGTDQLTTDTFRKLITKGTYQWNKNNTLQAFGTWNERAFEREGSRTNITAEAFYAKSENPQWTWNSTWISLLGSQTIFEGRFGGTNDHNKDIEENPDLGNHGDKGTHVSSVNSVGRADSERARLQMNAALSHHADNFIHGNHDFRFGVQIERSDISEGYQYNGTYRYQDNFGEPYRRYTGYSYLLEASNHQTSTYAQDDWKITDQLNLSLGVRWDHNRGFSYKKVVFATDAIAPRLGFVWILDQENQTVIKAHYGDYYDALLSRFYGLTGTYEPSAIQEYIDGQWVDVQRFEGSSNVKAHEGLKHPYVRQFTAGIDRVLPGNVPFGAHYIYRRWGNLLETVGQDIWEPVLFVNPLSGETITVYRFVSQGERAILTNPPGLYRRYDGLELFANKQFAGKLFLSGSLVYSKLTGNFFGNIFGVTGTFFLDDPNSAINRNGRLENDRTINWKIVGTYKLPWGFNTGFYFRHESGGAWTATVDLPESVSNSCCITILAEPLGSRRISSRNILDMRVEKEFPLYAGQLRFTVDIFNVFNSAHPLGVIDTNYESPFFGIQGGFTQPRQMRLGVRYTF